MKKFFQEESSLVVVLAASVLFSRFGEQWLNLNNGLLAYSACALILLAVLISAVFAVVRHSDVLAIKLGDPYGTLILTLAVISLEVVMISSVMLTGEPSPTMARDTMYAVMMIVTNGLVGFTLLLGGWKYHTQSFNLEGVKAYLVTITPLALLCLVLPNFTTSGAMGELSTGHSWMLIFASIALYCVFLIVQTKSHTHFFVDADNAEHQDHHGHPRSNLYHSVLLLVYLGAVIILAKKIAMPIDTLIVAFDAPPALGGFFVASLILLPEAAGAIKAAMNNQLQRAMNLYFGSVLASISLTVPAVLIIGYFSQQHVQLGLGNADIVLLLTTLAVCNVSFGSGKTNVLYGATHLVLFAVYLMLMFD